MSSAHTNTLLDNARSLRSNATRAERKLWTHLKGKQRLGRRFRRQHPIGRYIADFICLEENLIVELDGSHHALQTEKDSARSAWLETEGFGVARYWNEDVLKNIEGVVADIEARLGGKR